MNLKSIGITDVEQKPIISPQPEKEIVEIIEEEEVIEDNDLDDDDDYSEEESIGGKKEPTISERLNIEVKDMLTPGGVKAIAFKSPITNTEIVCFAPTNLILDRMFEEVARRKATDIQYRQMMIFVSNFVCKYGQREGDRCLPYRYVLEKIDPQETQLIFLIVSEFFRIGQL